MTDAFPRLDLHLSLTDRARIDRAAGLRGVHPSAFMRDAILREAESVIAAELIFTLSSEDSGRFLQALGVPFQPNAKLRKALASVEQA